tara:strand:- start:1420 stop:1749 length:330 start_codon:yes stop_codon:yes gene_type:complete
MPTFYFSYDEEGHTFYDNTQDLIKNTPRIEDCYVYEGDVTEQDIRQDNNDYREINVLEYFILTKSKESEEIIDNIDKILERKRKEQGITNQFNISEEDLTDSDSEEDTL